MPQEMSQEEFAKIAKAFTEVAYALHNVLLQEVGHEVGFVLVLDRGNGKAPLSASNQDPKTVERLLAQALSDLQIASARQQKRETH